MRGRRIYSILLSVYVVL
jgi:penicillin amidase